MLLDIDHLVTLPPNLKHGESSRGEVDRGGGGGGRGVTVKVVGGGCGINSSSRDLHTSGNVSIQLGRIELFSLAVYRSIKIKS